MSGNQEKDSIAVNNSLLRDQTSSLVGPELVHSVDGRWAQGRNGQLNPWRNLPEPERRSEPHRSEHEKQDRNPEIQRGSDNERSVS